MLSCSRAISRSRLGELALKSARGVLQRVEDEARDQGDQHENGIEELVHQCLVARLGRSAISAAIEGMGGASVRMPARSLAERARGLRAISPSVAPRWPLKGNAKLGAGPVLASGTWREAEGSRAGAVDEEALDDAVFERMEGDDNQPPAGNQQALRCMQGGDQFLEFAVHMDAQRLEGARGGMDAVLRALAAHRLLDGTHQCRRGGDRRFAARWPRWPARWRASAAPRRRYR